MWEDISSHLEAGPDLFFFVSLQLRCRADAPEPFGFLCIVNAERDRPVPVTQAEVAALATRVAALLPPPPPPPPPQQQLQPQHAGSQRWAAGANPGLTPPRFRGSGGR